MRHRAQLTGAKPPASGGGGGLASVTTSVFTSTVVTSGSEPPSQTRARLPVQVTRSYSSSPTRELHATANGTPSTAIAIAAFRRKDALEGATKPCPSETDRRRQLRSRRIRGLRRR